MTTPAMDLREEILRQCDRAAPDPWYPKTYAQQTGTDRDRLDPPLEELRMAGLIQLTEWVQGLGQGYRLTGEGRRVVQDEGELARLRAGEPVERRARPHLEELTDRPPTTWDRGEEVREALLSSRRPVVTLGLLAANLLVFGYGLLVAQRLNLPLPGLLDMPSEILERSGALHGSFLVRGEWWRLLTSCFVHIGWLHLAANMYFLFALGPLAERMWGSVRFLVLYLLAGFGGSCAMAIATPSVLGAGASGALWGLMASLAAWIVLNRRHLPPTLVGAWLRQLMTVFLLNVFISLAPQISAAAHFGGGAVGLAASLLLHYQRFGPRIVRWLAVLGLVLLPGLCLAAVLGAMDVDDRWAVLIDEQERRDFNLRLDASRDVIQRAEKVYDEVAGPLLSRHPSRRDPQAVEEAVTALAEQREQLAQLVKTSWEISPYRSEVPERARQALLARIEELLRLFELAEGLLKEGERATPADVRELEEQERRVVESARTFGKALRGE